MTPPKNRQAPPDPSDTEARWALKALAADPRLREAFLDSPLPASVLQPAADRYIVAADIEGLLPKLETLTAKGYRTGVEQVGEEARTTDEVDAVIAGYLTLMERLRTDSTMTAPVQLGFDLSNVGLLKSRDTARANTARLLDAGAELGSNIVLSMERSSFVDDILTVFHDLAPRHGNIGLTVQAHLHRTADDLPKLLSQGRKIRLVKGVYWENEDVALPRGQELNDRYVTLSEKIIEAGVPLTTATHDTDLLARLKNDGVLDAAVEVEMLHGVQPALLRDLKNDGVPCRVATVYGANWWLHFLHRLSEYPQNVVTALADLADPGRVRFGTLY